MNVPKAIELALTATVRKYAVDMGAGVILRAWQSLREDPQWKQNKDRSFPLVDIRCAPARTDDNQSTLAADVAALGQTKTDDDRDHAGISALYEGVETVFNSMFSQFRTGTAGTGEFAFFKAELTTHLGTTIDIDSVSLTWGEALAPYDDGGANSIGIGLVVHYGRPDF